ncbi:hypothetical protein ACP49_16340 [Clostridium botulinum]|uniref:hypothetical protein n=1 Tax=Clostridium TaxID=1485 RepID=UPI0005F96D20|nr:MULTISPECIES: hypothetical protein [Clostridium]KOM97100.1 hypothetical protein ACP53_11515 [Clostridium botulinum]KOM99517.1 hypothetical protein ACP49_16340 [Clostridium botulinum]MBY7004524.1 hypothetical protein [Clostridium botulinum]MCR1147188.1 hypothetical protein [Clostridium botulinum]NFH94536.1 hypothetical protein [Clostridium botulinum]
MKKNSYPIKLTFLKDINNGIVESTLPNEVIDSTNAIKIEIEINNSHYEVSQVRDSINEIFHSILQYFD